MVARQVKVCLLLFGVSLEHSLAEDEAASTGCLVPEGVSLCWCYCCSIGIELDDDDTRWKYFAGEWSDGELFNGPE